MHVEPIAHIRECAGPPAPGPCVQLVFAGPYRNADALRGIEGFSHLWLVWGAGEGVAAAGAGGVDACAAEGGAGLACEVTGTAAAAAAGRARANAASAAADVAGIDSDAAAATVDAARDARGTDGDAEAAAASGALPFHAPQTPAGLGLACARLEGVQRTRAQGTVLVLSGTPLAPGTPVYDVKPYLPYADAHPLAEEAHDDAR